ncbi:ferrous iron transporter B [Limnohabitans radicicola]|uniref:Ferrous iron transport protein B n=1 Tax=Limnohabitans radicicola TaxID=2771427 RepID=A0A927FJK3_9BURK|nr:ferrous iron transporter B [Limnohabitans radicicola]MBD8050725.1 ferrous iron transporter B [Limnohabitans radicicola]
MREQRVHLMPRGTLVALVGNPNCGKTALFNLLTGSRQKVANYAGATVEKKEGRLPMPDGAALRVLDLPGVYSLYPRSEDERVACAVLSGHSPGEKRPDALVCVVDATNLRRGLRLVLAVKRLGLPCLVVLNMADLAAGRGLKIDPEALSQALGLPVVTSVAVRQGGDAAIRQWLFKRPWSHGAPVHELAAGPDALQEHDRIEADHAVVQDLLRRLNLDSLVPDVLSDRIDRAVLHPWVGPVILLAVLFLVFQAVFAWAVVPMDFIKSCTDALAAAVVLALPDAWWRDLLVQGLLAGMGGVLVFLPQILILFFFILLLEESGYLPRAAFLLDRIMGGVGLSGRSFIPLLSSFACAVPGIMATRTIANRRDRLVTMLIAPLMTCSARLPVYTLLISAFVPARTWSGLQLQGLVLLGLYLAGIAGGMGVAWLLKRLTRAGRQSRPLMMELPSYHWPTLRSLALGLWQRAWIFLRRVGTVILLLTVAMWVLASYPAAPADALGPAIEYSYAGQIGHALQLLFAPLGFNWQISVALLLGMAAREVAIGALATVYAVVAADGGAATALAPMLAGQWSLATGMALLAWYIFAPQCLSTLVAIHRESGGWKLPAVTVLYQLALAYSAAFLTFRILSLW